MIYDADSGDLNTATLRPGNKHASYGVLTVLRRIIKKLKKAILRAELIIGVDAGFAVLY